MAGNIKGITVEIGGNTTGLSKALQDVNKQSGSLNKELKQINDLLKLDPTNVSLLAQKQQILTQQIDNTKKKLDTLKLAQQQMNDNGVDKNSEQYRDLERQIIRTEQSLDKYEGELAQVEAQSKETANATDGIGDKAQKAAGDSKAFSGKAVAAFAAVTAAVTAAAASLGQIVSKIKDAALSGAAYADDIRTMSAMYNVSASQLQKFGYASELVDVSMETLGKSLAKITKAMGAVYFGATKQASAFEEIGVSIKNADGSMRRSEDVFYDVVDALGAMGNETQADIYANALFGRSFQDIMPLVSAGTDTLRKLGEEAETVGYVLGDDALDSLNDFQDSLDRMKSMTETATRAFSIGMAPALKEITDSINEKLASPAMQANLKKMGAAVGEIAKAFADFAMFVVDHGEVILKVILSIAAGFAAWKISSIISGAIKAFGKFSAAVQQTGGNIVAAIRSINTASMASIIGAIVAVISVVVSLASELGKASEEMEELKDTANTLSGDINDTAKAFNEANATFDIQSGKTKELADEMLALNDQIENGELNDIEAAAAKKRLVAAAGEYNTVVGGTAVTINKETGLLNENASAIAQNTKKLIENARAQAYNKAYVDIINQKVDAELNEATALEAIKKNIGGMNKEEQRRIENLIKTKDTQGLINALQGTWNKELGAARDVLIDTSEQEKRLAGNMDILSSAAETNGIALDGNTDKVEENTVAVTALSDAEALRLLRAQEGGKVLDETQQAQLDAYKSNNEEQYKSLSELVQKESELQKKRIEILTNSNDAINYKDQISLKERLDNYDNNAKKVLEYEDGLASLRERAMSESNSATQQSMLAYIDSLGDYSTESMGIISQLVTQFGKGGGEMFGSLADRYMSAMNSRAPGMKDATYKVGSGAEQAGGDGIAAGDDMQNEAVAQMQTTVDKMSSMIGEDGPFYWLGIGIINRLVTGMWQMEDKLYQTVDRIVNNIKSKFTFDVSVSGSASGASVRSFASGGILSQPELVRVAERGPEAIIPLAQLSGILAGAIDKSGGAGGNVYVTVNTQEMTRSQTDYLITKVRKELGRRT